MSSMFARCSAAIALIAALVIPSTAFASGGGVQYSYSKVDLGGKTEWVLVPKAVNGLGGKASATTLKTAFELLRKDKRASYGKSTITVSGAPPKAKVTIKIDPKVARYSLIVIAESVYTLTELGATSVSFPGYASGALTREDVPFPAYTLTVPLWKAVGRFDTNAVMVQMPDGSLVPSRAIAKRWKSKDADLRKAVYSYLDAKDNYTVQTVAKLLPELKLPYKTQVVALLGHKDVSVRRAALGILEKDRNDNAVLDGVAKMLAAEKDDKAAGEAAKFLGQSTNSAYKVLLQYHVLKTGSDAEKIKAAKALSLNKDKRTVEHLQPLLESKNKKVASAAAKSLASIGADAAQMKAIKNTKIDKGVRLDIARDLGKDKNLKPSVAGLGYVASNGADHEALSALEKLAKKKNREATKVIEKFLSSPKENVRLGALAQLEVVGDADSTGAIAAAMKKGKNERDLEEAGYRIMVQQSMSTILDKTKDKNALVQRMAYRAVGERAQKEKGNKKAFSALESGVKSRDALVRGAAARAVGTYANSDAERILKAMVKDKSAAVRADVAHGIGYLKGGKLAKELEALLGDSDDSVKAEAARSLGKRGEAGKWNDIKALAKSRSADARAASMTAMAALVSRSDSKGVNEVISALSGAVTDKNIQVREAAIAALGTFGEEKAVTAISLQAGAEEERVRLAAIDALANTKKKSAVAVIADRLLDESHAVRKHAVRALGRLKAKSELSAHLKEEKDPDVKALISATLKKL